MRWMMATMLGLMFVLPAGAADEIKVTPVKLVETRVKHFIKPENEFFAGKSEMKLTIRVEGKPVEGAASYGKIKFEKAVDDTGGDLKPNKEKSMFSFGNGDDWTEVGSGMADFGKPEDEPGFRMQIELNPPARKATKIAHLKGEFPVLAGGENKTVQAKKLKSLVGKKVDDPVLKKAGLEISIKKPKKDGGGLFGGGENAVPVEVKGDLKALKEIDIVDAKGESLTSGKSWSESGDERTYNLDAGKPVSDEMILEVDLVLGLKEIKVEFDLEDLELQ